MTRTVVVFAVFLFTVLLCDLHKSGKALIKSKRIFLKGKAWKQPQELLHSGSEGLIHAAGLLLKRKSILIQSRKVLRSRRGVLLKSSFNVGAS